MRNHGEGLRVHVPHRAGAAAGDTKPAGADLGSDEPLADWERDLLVGSEPAVGEASEAVAEAGAPVSEATDVTEATDITEAIEGDSTQA